MRSHYASDGVRPLIISEIISFPEDVDICNSRRLGRQLRAAFAQDVDFVVADMTDTEFCDSSGMRQLLLAHREAVASNRELRLVLNSRAVRRALNLSGFDQLLNVYSSMREALEGAARRAEEPSR